MDLTERPGIPVRDKHNGQQERLVSPGVSHAARALPAAWAIAVSLFECASALESSSVAYATWPGSAGRLCRCDSSSSTWAVCRKIGGTLGPQRARIWRRRAAWYAAAEAGPEGVPSNYSEVETRIGAPGFASKEGMPEQAHLGDAPVSARLDSATGGALEPSHADPREADLHAAPSPDGIHVDQSTFAASGAQAHSEAVAVSESRPPGAEKQSAHPHDHFEKLGSNGESLSKRKLSRTRDVRNMFILPVGGKGFGPALSVEDMTRSLFTADDPLWSLIRRESVAGSVNDPRIASLISESILNHETLEDALAAVLSAPLRSDYFASLQWKQLFDGALAKDAQYQKAVRADLLAAMRRDAASTHPAAVLLFSKGYQALQSYRLAHWLWHQNRKSLALYMQSLISAHYGVDIHPAARIGSGVLIDHATGIVIGETAVIDDDCSILHNVTLGGTGKEIGDRHPKIGQGVLIGAGATILGNITVGKCARITPGSVVLKPVAPYTVVSGVPAKAVGRVGLESNSGLPSEEMEYALDHLAPFESAGDFGVDGVGI
ncbi:Serine acetyltransferase [Porphyridium purpureum]|uniref:serine O-acetyltransferase n=1 Tax=Porphyridium purpureum TaxID=35688 RepID=A0A5J4ZA83_PORPP|nr:Serine acetyltransferase [Porphyridium purpureum]|eukprot:POR7026..scf295_1